MHRASISCSADNAQGKTNILEAVYLMATLRSFRGVGAHSPHDGQEPGRFPESAMHLLEYTTVAEM